jgi:hypothetical protein
MPDDTQREAPGAEAPVSFERERLALEAERLALERERLDARAKELEELRAAFEPRDGREVTIGLGALAVAVGVALLLGAALGGALGFDAGGRAAARPRRVELSPAFKAVLCPPPGAQAADGAEDPGKWLPRRRTVFPEDLVLIR